MNNFNFKFNSLNFVKSDQHKTTITTNQPYLSQYKTSPRKFEKITQNYC